MGALRVNTIKNKDSNTTALTLQTNGRGDPARIVMPVINGFPAEDGGAGDIFVNEADGNKLYISKGDGNYQKKSGFDAPSGTFEFGWSSSQTSYNYEATPYNIWFRRIIFAARYTVSELESGGCEGGAIFRNLTWYQNSAVNSSRSQRNMNIRMFHTTDTSSIMAPIAGESKVTVYSMTGDFTPSESVGTKTITFNGGEFEWDGSNDIVVEWCTSQNESGYQARGSMRVVRQNGFSYYRRTDSSGNSCNDNAEWNEDCRPSIKMDFG